MNQRLLVLALLVGVGASVPIGAGAQSLDQRVTLRQTAIPIAAILVEIGAKTKVDLRPSADVAKDVVIVSVREVTLRDLMMRLAETLDAEWQRVGEGYRLVRSDTIERRQRQSEIELRIPTYRRAITDLQKAPSEAGELDAPRATKLIDEGVEFMKGLIQDRGRGLGGGQAMNGSRMGNLMGQLPSTKGINQLLALIDPAHLAALAPGERVVFATRPTRMQIGLPATADQIVQRILREQSVLADAMKKRVGNDVLPGPWGQLTIQAPKGPVKVALAVTRNGDDDGLSVQLMIGDTTGQSLGDGFSFIAPEPAPARTNPLIGAASTPISFSPDALSLAKLFTRRGGRPGGGGEVAMLVTVDGPGGGDRMVSSSTNGDAGPAPTANLRTRILQPEKYDPLAGVPSEIAFAVAGDRPLVALVPDSGLSEISQAATTGITTDQAKAQMADWGWAYSETGDWSEIKPIRPASERNLRTNRAALGTALRQLVQQGSWTLDQRATYALQSPDRARFDTIDMVYLRAINPGAADRELGNLFGGTRDLLRFFGSLGMSQRQSLAQGQPINLGTLTPAQRTHVHRMVYFGMGGLNTIRPSERAGRGEAVQDRREVRSSVLIQEGRGGGGGPMIQMAFGGGGLAEERTEVLPTGIPSSGQLTWRLNQTPAVYGRLGENGAPVLMDLGDVGRREAMRTGSPGMPAGMMPNMAPMDQFQPVNRTDITFLFSFTDRVSLTRQLSEAPAFSAGGFVGYDRLPADLRKTAEAEAQRTRNMMDRMGQPGGPGRGPRNAVP